MVPEPEGAPPARTPCEPLSSSTAAILSSTRFTPAAMPEHPSCRPAQTLEKWIQMQRHLKPAELAVMFYEQQAAPQA